MICTNQKLAKSSRIICDWKTSFSVLNSVVFRSSSCWQNVRLERHLSTELEISPRRTNNCHVLVAMHGSEKELDLRWDVSVKCSSVCEFYVHFKTTSTRISHETNNFRMTPELFPSVSRTDSECPHVGHNDHRAVTYLSVNIWTRPSVACHAVYSLRDNAVDWFHTRNRSREARPFLFLPRPVALHSVVCTSNWNLRAIWSTNGHSSDVSHVYWSPATNTRWPSIWRGSRRRRHPSEVSSSWLSYLDGWTSVWHCHRDEEYLVREREWVYPRERRKWRSEFDKDDEYYSFDLMS